MSSPSKCVEMEQRAKKKTKKENTSTCAKLWPKVLSSVLTDCVTNWKSRNITSR